MGVIRVIFYLYIFHLFSFIFFSYLCRLEVARAQKAPKATLEKEQKNKNRYNYGVQFQVDREQMA